MSDEIHNPTCPFCGHVILCSPFDRHVCNFKEPPPKQVDYSLLGQPQTVGDTSAGEPR